MEHCVVCMRMLEGAKHFSNAWERSLGTRACCSTDCVVLFDEDKHWLPSARPTEVSEAEADRLIRGNRARLEKGDAPGVVVRDLLLAGVPPWRARATLHGVAGRTAASDRWLGGLNAVGLLAGVLGGSVFRVRDPRRGAADVGEVLDGAAQVDAWEARFGK